MADMFGMVLWVVYLALAFGWWSGWICLTMQEHIKIEYIPFSVGIRERPVYLSVYLIRDIVS